MTKELINESILNKLNSLSDIEFDLLIHVYKYLNDLNELSTRYELANMLSNNWFKENNNMSLDEFENKWNESYKYYNDTDGLFYGFEDENGYIK